MDYKDLIKKYNKYYNEIINRNKDKLLEAFIIYYGEEYRDIITERFNRIIYSWYISDYINKVCNVFLPKKMIKDRIFYTKEILKKLGYDIETIKCRAKFGHIFVIKDTVILEPAMIFDTFDQDDNKLDDLLYFLFDENRIFNFEYKKNIIYNFFSLDDDNKKIFARKVFGKDILSNEELSKIKDAIIYMDYCLKEKKKCEEKYPDIWLFSKNLENIKNGKNQYAEKIIGSTNESLLLENYKEEVEFINKELYKNPLCITLPDSYGLIFFPMFYMCDMDLIHEINHIVKSSFLLFKHDSEEQSYIDKSGLNTSWNKKEILEELLTDYQAIEITKIFHRLGGKIFENTVDFSILTSAYEKFLPLIDKFYKSYKPLIDKASITESANLIYTSIKKDIFIEFNDYITEVYTSKIRDYENGINELKGLSYEQVEYANYLVEKMDNKKRDDLNFDEYAEFLKLEEIENMLEYCSNRNIKIRKL